MIRGLIATFRNITPPVNQKFFRKNQIETITCHRVSINLTQSCPFRLRHFVSQCFRSLHTIHAKMENLSKNVSSVGNGSI